MKLDSILDKEEPVLVTGSNGFVGSRVVQTLLDYGFTNLRCFVRPSSNLSRLNPILAGNTSAKIEVCTGSLLSAPDCGAAAGDAAVIIHLAAGIGKSFPDCFMNSVITTRNLLECVRGRVGFKRFLNVSSFAVYTNRNIRRGGVLDESCEVDAHPEERGEAYAYGKYKQDALVLDYHDKYGVPCVIVRPGVVFGPGNSSISPRVGIDTFGFFLHLGGRNEIPLTFVDNCVEAIVLAALTKGVDGEVFNIVDNDLPTSRSFLKLYKRNVKRFPSIFMPYPLFYFLNYLWERYSSWSRGQLPPLFNRGRCAVYWKGNRYANVKLQRRLGWPPGVPMDDALQRYYSSAREQAAVP